MPSFDYTVSLGNILTILGFAWVVWMGVTRVYIMLDLRISRFEEILEGHAKTLAAHAGRMEKQDDLLLRLVGDVQRLIGYMEARNKP